MSFYLQWFNDKLLIQKTGDDLTDFFEFYTSNKDREEKCFLITLGTEDANATASQIAIYENGKVETSDFKPPEKLLTMGKNFMWKVNK